MLEKIRTLFVRLFLAYIDAQTIEVVDEHGVVQYYPVFEW